MKNQAADILGGWSCLSKWNYSDFIELSCFSLVLLQLGDIKSTEPIFQSAVTQRTCSAQFSACYSLIKKCMALETMRLKQYLEEKQLWDFRLYYTFLITDDLQKAMLLKIYQLPMAKLDLMTGLFTLIDKEHYLQASSYFTWVLKFVSGILHMVVLYICVKSCMVNSVLSIWLQTGKLLSLKNFQGSIKLRLNLALDLLQFLSTMKSGKLIDLHFFLVDSCEGRKNINLKCTSKLT